MTTPGRMPGLPCARLLPAEIRVWAEALWAEAYEAPSARERLAWLAGGIWLVARESVMIRRVRNAVLFGAGAAQLAWTAWSGEATSADTALLWYLVVATVLVLAGLPSLVRRRFGPVTDGRAARGLRTAAYAAIFVLIAALAGVLRTADTARQSPNLSQAGMLVGWTAFLVILAGYVAVILAVTAQRPAIAPATLAIGIGTGLALGLVMYAIMPLGFAQIASAPWLRGSAIDPLVGLAWALLFGGPVAAALLAGRRYPGADSPLAAKEAKIRQSAAAGVLATVVGSLVVSVLGTVTLALLPRSGLLAGVLYGGEHLTGADVASRAHYLASNGAPGYFLIWLFFPLIGIGLGAWTGLALWGSAAQPGRGPGGGGPSDGEQPSAPPGGHVEEPEDEQTIVAAGVFVAVRG